MRAFRYRINLFGSLVLQIFEPLWPGADQGIWRDAKRKDIVGKAIR